MERKLGFAIAENVEHAHVDAIVVNIELTKTC